MPFSRKQKTVLKPKFQAVSDPKTLGDKIRKRRLELGLMQKEVGTKLGVDEASIYLWENNRVQPGVRYYPNIIEFLGYFPFEIDTNTLSGKIKDYRFRHGLGYKALAKCIKMDEFTIQQYEKGKSIPTKKTTLLLKKILSL